ncbi:MAG TPA: aminoglycoside phosphotransferase family protein [Chloroflexota bacterium]|nr:aminoglycoside phosphotransferase family protein [Chloroflexota bacterium]
MQIPARFEHRVRDSLGDRGAAWLRALPVLVADLSERWGITVGDPFELSYNYVAAARRHDGTQAVIKLAPPWEDGEFEREIEAVRLYDGNGISRLLEADVLRRAILLERLVPGRMLTDVAVEDDDAATRIGADVLRRLWRPAADLPDPSRFKPLAEWFLRAFPLHRIQYGGPGPFPASVLEFAEALVPELLASSPGDVLLHGDFHHYNVLSSERGWLAIDPKGMLGDPGYEVGPFLLNPDVAIQPKTRALLDRRLDILAAELPYDRHRLRDWAIAHAVLSACWSAEGPGDEWRPAIALAENLIDHA